MIEFLKMFLVNFGALTAVLVWAIAITIPVVFIFLYEGESHMPRILAAILIGVFIALTMTVFEYFN